MRKCIVLVVVSFLFSSFFSINLKGKNEEEIKKMILGKWIDKSRSKDGYLTRMVYPEVPVRVEYQLTEFGLRYLDKLIILSEWIKDEMEYVIQSRKNYK